MRLCCDIEVRSRCLPSFNLSKNNRPSKCRLSLTRKGPIITLVVSTLRDAYAHSYKVTDNLEAVFSKFVRMGKCTFRFREPADDVSVSNADAFQLRCFLHMLKLVLSGKEMDRVPATMVLPYKGVKTSMTVSSKRELLTTTLPHSLITLSACACEMTRLDARVLQLVNLTTLYLSRNRLTTLPETLGPLRVLADLDLSYNELQEFPPALLQPPVCRSLQTINLNGNPIKTVPEEITALTSVYRLMVMECGLQRLPQSLGKLSRSLRVLDVDDNALEVLPFSILQLRLHHIAIANNPLRSLDPDDESNLPLPFPIPSLLELSARSVCNNRVKFSKVSLPSVVVEYLKSAKPCHCGRYCFEVSREVLCTVKLTSCALAASVGGTRGENCVVLQGYACSYQHFCAFQRIWNRRFPR